MPEIKVPQIDGAEVRSIAEERLGERSKTEPWIVGEPLSLLHELQVHKIELDMQNEELRQARSELETALEKYTDLYDFAPVGYVTLDRSGTIRATNLTGSGLIGVERSRLIGRRFVHSLTAVTQSVFFAFLGKVFRSPAKEACEVELLKKGASELFVKIVGVAASSGEECRIALIDISERKRAEKTLRVAKEAGEALRVAQEATEKLRLAKDAAVERRLTKESAEATARTKSQFFANMNHELRTPMTGILGMLQLALEEDLAPVPRKYLERTLGSAYSLLQILNDILDMAKIEAKKIIIEEKPFSLQGCLTEAVDFIITEVQRKGLDFAISVAEEVPDTVVGDHVRLRQVLINLIGNAVKFTKSGKIVVHVTIAKATSDEKLKFTFTVTDTGIGIPDDKKDLLFKAFSQVDTSDSRSYGGTGLGLAISREIVELMGGTIYFESEESVGSTFSFTVPLGEARRKSDTTFNTCNKQTKNILKSANGPMRRPKID
jgi:PAS domain S-box-containing protein